MGATIKETLKGLGLSDDQRKEILTMVKRQRPDFISLTLENNTNADAKMALFNRTAIKYDSDVVLNKTVVSDVVTKDYVTSTANGITGLRKLTEHQRPFIVGAVLEVQADADADQFTKALDYISTDYDGQTSKSLKPLLAKNRSGNSQEQQTRVLDIKTVLDESNDIVVTVKANTAVTFHFNVVEYLDRPW